MRVLRLGGCAGGWQRPGVCECVGLASAVGDSEWGMRRDGAGLGRARWPGAVCQAGVGVGALGWAKRCGCCAVVCQRIVTSSATRNGWSFAPTEGGCGAPPFDFPAAARSSCPPVRLFGAQRRVHRNIGSGAVFAVATPPALPAVWLPPAFAWQGGSLFNLTNTPTHAPTDAPLQN